MNLDYIISVFVILIKGLPYTLLIMIVGFILGGFLGFVLSLFRVFKIPFLSQFARIYISFFRGTPLLVQIMIFYQGIPLLLLNTEYNEYIRQIPAIYFILFTYVLYSAAYLSEIFRSSILSVSKSQMEACFSVGMNSIQALKHVILPQATVVALPNLSNFIILLIKDTSLASMATVPEVMGKVSQEIANTQSVFTVFIIAAVIYWIVCAGLEYIFNYLENKRSIFKK